MIDFIQAPEVAELTGFHSPRAFLDARERLEGTQGFPSPLPTCLRPLKWRRSAVLTWVEAQGQLPAIAADLQNAGPNVHLLAEARRA